MNETTDPTEPRPRPQLPRKWLFFGVFAVLVVASNFVRSQWPLRPAPRPGQELVEVRLFARGDIAPAATGARAENGAASAPPAGPPPLEEAIVPVPEKTLRLAVRDTGAPAAPAPGAPAILLLHGIPGNADALSELCGRLARHHRVIAPDLPGMGASQREVPDYSAEVTARAMLDLLDKLGVARAHVVGEGQGGVVALQLASQAPGRVASLSLLSASGPQEFELLGNHIANKFVYFFHKTFIAIYQNLLPHFGLFDLGSVNSAYAGVFWDNDYSRNNAHLRAHTGPLFIAHGEDDLLVPCDAARYSAQDVAPQARTFFTPGGHHVFESATGAGLLAPRMEAFFSEVAAGQGARAADTPVRPLEEIRPPPAQGRRLLVLMLIIIVCAFVAEDPTCLATGVLVSQGILGFTAGTIACLVSIFLGDFTLYLIGYALGRPALRKAPLKWLIAEYEIDRMSAWFEKRGFQGLMLIVTSRFIPASRVPTFVCAGVMRLSLWRLSILFFIAAALWTPLLIWGGEHFGAIAIERFPHLKRHAMWIVLGALAAVWVAMHFIVPALTWRGRRELVMKARKRARHEFWPASWLYAPPALAALAGNLLRLNGAAHSAANPGLGWLGGATGEAKSETLSRLAAGAPPASIAEFARIPAGGAPEERAARVRRFMEERNLAFPIVLKPDTGDGGLGVNLVHSEAQVAEWLGRFHEDALAQRWAGGGEFEIIWARQPGQERGCVLSVVEKQFPSVTGDGHRTLEELIWADDTAVSQAKIYLRLNWRRAAQVIPAGERVVLTRIGTHALGARMLDRQELRTAALAAEFDKIADKVGGLHYVVYDVRVAPSANWARGAGEPPVFRAGDMTITGVSGPCAVSSRLRDQSCRLAYAQRSAFRQIGAAFAAADANRRAGHRAAPAIAAIAARAEARSRQIIDLRAG